jgi:glycerol-3-phosphate O-acyltransferase
MDAAARNEARGADAARALEDAPWEPGWPSADRRVVFLLDASGALERRVLVQWIERHRHEAPHPALFDLAHTPPSRRRTGWWIFPTVRRARKTEGLEVALAEGDDPLLAPLRVAWLPPRGPNGTRRVTLRTILLGGGDPRDPGWLRQRWILRRRRERCQVVAGEPAPLSELHRRWRAAEGLDREETAGLADFVARQAALALERAERRLTGSRYKVPRLVHEDILARPGFRGGLTPLARALGQSQASVERDARRYLREIAAAHSPTMLDLAYQLFRFMYRRSYERLDYDRARLEQVAALSQRYPVVFLPTHRSNLDHPTLHCMLYENGLPASHTAGGLNMNFFLLGSIMQRAGIFFIRRTFKDNAVYKHVLHHYIDYLIEKRFSLEWYIEGGRSRSGKLLPPRLGLLAYAVDAYRRGKSDDVYLIPVSIAFDQIQDVGDYVREQSGGAKQRESFTWFLGTIRRLRRYRSVQVRLGTPLSVAEMVGPADPARAPDPDERSLELQKVAFEVCVRINEVTPITATSLVTLALLGAGDQALTVEEIRGLLSQLLDYVRRRELPTTGEIDLRSSTGVTQALAELVRSRVVTCFSEGPEAVYRIRDDQHLAAAYYRNTIIHFFVTPAISELALLGAADAPEDRREAFFAEALRLRDLLKFEFFFAERERFIAEVRREVALHDPDWERRLADGPAQTRAVLRGFRPLSAHRVVRPFLEAYRVVADALVRWEPGRPFDRPEFVKRCLALGKQYTLQRRIRGAESVSKSYFETGLRLAEHRGLLAVDQGGRATQDAFAAELTAVVRRIDAIAALAAARRSGVL